MDREKVIKGLHQHCEGSMFDRCGECPYYDVADEPFVCRDMLLNDLNALLKEQQKQIEQMNFIYGFIYGGQVKEITELVRCKDCRHRDPEDHKCDHGHDILWELPRPDDWFCADGERKSADENLMEEMDADPLG